jgi:hypothetical protein
MDADVLVRVVPAQLDPLLERLEPSFFVDPVAARAALRAGQSFNLLHRATMFKVDLFPAGDRPFDRAQLARRARQALDPAGERSFYVATAEDTVLAKLTWFRAGGETSERHWRDVLGVLRVNQAELDRGYLEDWATQLHVRDLLDRAWGESEATSR